MEDILHIQDLKTLAGVHAQLSYYMEVHHDYQELKDDIWSYLQSVKGEIDAFKAKNPDWWEQMKALKSNLESIETNNCSMCTLWQKMKAEEKKS